MGKWSVLLVLGCGLGIFLGRPQRLERSNPGRAYAAWLQPRPSDGPGRQPRWWVTDYYQDDCPAIAAAPDGSVWTAWLSFYGTPGPYRNPALQRRKVGCLQWVPGTSGDSWLPQVAADSAGRVLIVWSQQVDGNFDLYARRFDPGETRVGGTAPSYPSPPARYLSPVVFRRQAPRRCSLPGVPRPSQQHLPAHAGRGSLGARDPGHQP